MRTFRTTRDVDLNGKEWSPQVSIVCPYCNVTLWFYVQLRDNKCKYCLRTMPFSSAMIKNTELRIKYHVRTEAEGKYCKQTDTHSVLLRERN